MEGQDGPAGVTGGITRGGFLKAVGAAGGTLVLWPRAARFGRASGAEAEAAGLPKLDLAAFSRLVGKSFRLQGAQGGALLRLESVTDLSAGTGFGGPASGAECFSLYFRQQRGAELASGTYEARQARLGRFLLSVEARRLPRGLEYEAVFYRLGQGV